MSETSASPSVEVVVSENGPYEIVGPVRIVGADGNPMRSGERFYLCRCGHSKSKPYCDNSHREVNFTDDGLGPKPKSQR